MEYLKLILNDKPESLATYEACEYEGDVRAIIISQKLEYELEEQENVNLIQGKFRYYYRKVLPLQTIAIFGVIFLAMI